MSPSRRDRASVGESPDRGRTRAAEDERRRVLLVDDSLTFRSTLGQRLRAFGHEAILASSGKEALTAADVRAPDAAIIDLVMPEFDGLETCRGFRRVFDVDTLPILMLTATDDLRARMQCRAAGATEFLVKVSEFDLVVTGVLDFIRRTTARRSWGNETPSSVRSKDETGLLGDVIAACGLARVLAEPAVMRACKRADVDPESMMAADLVPVLPQLEKTLRLFLKPPELAERLEVIAQLGTAAGRGRKGNQG